MLLEYGNLFFIYAIGIFSVLLFGPVTYLITNKYSITLNKKHTNLIFIFSKKIFIIFFWISFQRS